MTYIGTVKGLANHYHKSPDKLSNEQIQRMMGHVALSTTARYMHVSNEFISTIKSPLEFLEMEMDQPSKAGRIQ